MANDRIQKSLTDFLNENGYTVSDSIGKGSFADVRLAFSFTKRKSVAVKIMIKSDIPSDFLKRFLPREIEIVKRLNHRNIIKFIECMNTEDRIFIFMELAENGTLLELIRKEKYIPEARSCKYFHHLVDGVAYLHSNGIVHRDIKCENLLLDRFDIIKITDFGFARAFLPIYLNNETENKDREIILSSTFCGSYAYASPEILRGKPYEPHMSDVWSMGVVLYVMVCGRLPCNSDKPEIIIKKLTKKISFPAQPLISKCCKELIREILSPLESRIYIPQIMKNRWYKFLFSSSESEEKSHRKHVKFPPLKKSNEASFVIPENKQISNLKNKTTKQDRSNLFSKRKLMNIFHKNKTNDIDNLNDIVAFGKHFLNTELIDENRNIENLNKIHEQIIHHKLFTSLFGKLHFRSSKNVHPFISSIILETSNEDEKKNQHNEELELQSQENKNDLENLSNKNKNSNENCLENEKTVPIKEKELAIASSSILTEESSSEIKDITSVKFYSKDIGILKQFNINCQPVKNLINVSSEISLQKSATDDIIESNIEKVESTDSFPQNNINHNSDTTI